MKTKFTHPEIPDHTMRDIAEHAWAIRQTDGKKACGMFLTGVAIQMRMAELIPNTLDAQAQMSERLMEEVRGIESIDSGKFASVSYSSKGAEELSDRIILILKGVMAAKRD